MLLALGAWAKDSSATRPPDIAFKHTSPAPSVSTTLPPATTSTTTAPGVVEERAVATAGSPFVLRFDSGVPAGILSSLEEMVLLACEDFGDTGPLVVHVYSTVDIFVAAHETRSQDRARKDIEGGGVAFAGPGRIWIYSPRFSGRDVNARRLTVLHEYFHTVQARLAGPRGARAPLWLVEGSAKYFETRAGADRGYTSFAKQAATQMRKSAGLGPLSLFEIDGGVPSRGGNGEAYTLGFLACEYLAQTVGVEALQREFWLQLASTTDWHAAFARAFGMPVEQFYEAFENFRRQV